MHWIRMHPYAAACALAGILLIIGAIIVERRTRTEPRDLTVWGTSGAPLVNPTSYAPGASEESLPTPSGTSVEPVYIAPPAGNRPAVSETTSIEELLALIRAPRPATFGESASGEVTAGSEFAFSLIPSNLFTAETPQRPRTESQQRLFEYGNGAALHIQAFENNHQNAPLTLQDQAENRTSTAKKEAVKRIAQALKTVGDRLAAMETVPPSATTVHAALARAYQRAGESLSLVPDAASDEDFIAAIESYNAAADSVVRAHVRLSQLFTLSEVSFSQNDPGSLFMFSGNGAF